MTFYKAVRPDGTDFRTGKVRWAPKTRKVGRARIVKHPTAQQVGSHASQYLSASTVTTDCTGAGLPCRLLTLEPVEGYEVTTPDPADLPNKRAAVAWRVTGELDPILALGPQGEHAAALIERARRLTADEARLLEAAWLAARDVARGAARDARDARGAAWLAARDVARGAARDARDARGAARDVAGDAAWDAARGARDARDAARDVARGAAWIAAGGAAWDAACALVVRDLISTHDYDTLTLPWRTTIGRIHPDDPEVQA